MIISAYSDIFWFPQSIHKQQWSNKYYSLLHCWKNDVDLIRLKPITFINDLKHLLNEESNRLTLTHISIDCIFRSIALWIDLFICLFVYEVKRKIKKPKNNRLYEYKINFTFAINQLKDNVVRFVMKVAELELYELMISKISKNLSVIRPNRKFFDKTVETRQISTQWIINVCVKSLS
jgi:hypothetical protein